MKRTLLISLAALAALFITTAPAQAAKDDLLLVSAPLTAPFALDQSASWPDVSGDGRYVAFQSPATNLVPGGTDGTEHVYVKDVATGEVELISRSVANVPADAAAGGASISADGRYVAFSSGADNLVDGVTSGPNQSHVFVRDRREGTLIAADRTIAGVLGNGSATNPSISADGAKVAFLSISSNLTPGVDSQPHVDAFAKDLTNGNIVLLSRGNGPSGTASNGTTSDVEISADGTQAAFVTTADNLGVSNSLEKVYRRGTVNDAALALVSRMAGVNGDAADADAERPAISANGSVVAFQSEASNLSGSDEDDTIDVFARDMGATTVNLISRSNGSFGAPGDDASFTPSISDDGSRVSFVTYSDSLGSEDLDTGTNVYVRDRAAGTTTFVSREAGESGPAGQPNSDQATISGDGRWVAFRGQGDNLSTVDSDDHAEIYSRDVLGGPPFILPEEPEDPQDPQNPQNPNDPQDPQDPVDPPKGGQPAALRLLSLTASRKRFTVKRGTRITVRTSREARVRFTLARQVKRGTSKAWKRVATITGDSQGTLKLTVKRRFGKKPIRPGRYRLTVTLEHPATGQVVPAGRLTLRVNG